MNEAMSPVVSRDINTITAEIRVIKEQTTRMLLSSYVELGRRLTEAKELLPHGAWGEWLKNEADFSQRTANNLMNIYARFGADQASLFGETNSQALANLTYTQAVLLLKVPDDEREEFVKENDVEHLSTRELERLVKERTAELEAENQQQALKLSSAESRVAVLQGELESSADELKKSREIISELESRPVATVVERDEDAIKAAAEEARTAALQEYNTILTDSEKTLKEQAKKLAEAEKERDKALKEAEALRRDKAQLETAAASKETMDKLNEQYEQRIKEAEDRAAAAEKQLKLASPAAMEFSTAFNRAQTELNAMAAALKKIEDTELLSKLRQAATAVLDKWAPEFKGQS